MKGSLAEDVPTAARVLDHGVRAAEAGAGVRHERGMGTISILRTERFLMTPTRHGKCTLLPLN